jgi:hypothetical protein
VLSIFCFIYLFLIFVLFSFINLFVGKDIFINGTLNVEFFNNKFSNVCTDCMSVNFFVANETDLEGMCLFIGKDLQLWILKICT